jgi:hypothetical protein
VSGAFSVRLFFFWAFSALLVLSDFFSFFLFCRRALCCSGLFYVGLFSVRTFFFFSEPPFKDALSGDASNPVHLLQMNNGLAQP